MAPTIPYLIQLQTGFLHIIFAPAFHSQVFYLPLSNDSYSILNTDGQSEQENKPLAHIFTISIDVYSSMGNGKMHRWSVEAR